MLATYFKSLLSPASYRKILEIAKKKAKDDQEFTSAALAEANNHFPLMDRLMLDLSKVPNEKVRSNDLAFLTNLKEEVNQEDGVYYYTTNEKKQVAGFDFAILNSERNLHKLHD